VDAYRTNWVFVKIITDDGHFGLGESTIGYSELSVAKAIEEIGENLIGTDPHNIEAFWHYTNRDKYWGGNAIITSAMAGIEMAMWDIKGKDLGVPVYQLLGGRFRNEIPCYGNAWFTSARTSEQFAIKAKKALKLGYKGLKFDPFDSAWQSITKKELKTALERIAAVKDILGDERSLIIEGHGRFNVPTAILIGKKLEDFDILWFEEPIPPNNFEGLKYIKNQINVPVAAGERIVNIFQFKTFLNMSCADYAQPDVSHVGLGEFRKMAAIAEANHIPICPHNATGPINNAATIQVSACCPNIYLLETMAYDTPIRNKISKEQLILDNGNMLIPESPGLGIDIDEKEIVKYPYGRHQIRHYDGKLTDIRPLDETVYYSIK
jgi:galactonate dehydratase